MGGDPGGDEVELVNQLVAACEIDALQSEVRSSLELDAVVTFLSGTPPLKLGAWNAAHPGDRRRRQPRRRPHAG
jgi:hypothetical protein